MKTFKARSILFSLTAMLVFAVFFTACTKEEATTDKVLDQTELTQLLANDASFKTIQKFKTQVFEAVEAGAKDMPVLSEEDLSSLTAQIFNNIPDLKQLDKASMEVVTFEATELGNAHLRNPCVQGDPDFSACECCRQNFYNSFSACYNAALAYYFNGGDYNTYIDLYNDCLAAYSPIRFCPC